MKRLLAAVAAIGLLAGPALAGDPVPTVVIDGDTLDVGGDRVRLWGIDAPETDQPCFYAGSAWPCGVEATLQLGHLISGHRLDCAIVDTDRYGRYVARCEINGNDVGRAMVRKGWARDYERYSGGEYANAEAVARRDGLGIWRGQFDNPWNWRRAH